MYVSLVVMMANLIRQVGVELDTHGVIETKWDGAVVHLNFFAKGLKVINA